MSKELSRDCYKAMLEFIDNLRQLHEDLREIPFTNTYFPPNRKVLYIFDSEGIFRTTTIFMYAGVYKNRQTFLKFEDIPDADLEAYDMTHGALDSYDQWRHANNLPTLRPHK